MTQQYRLGELSLILGELQAVATNEAALRDIARLRREAETGPLRALASVAARALVLTDGWCWDSLMRGDSAAFARQAVNCGNSPSALVCWKIAERIKQTGLRICATETSKAQRDHRECH